MAKVGKHTKPRAGWTGLLLVGVWLLLLAVLAVTTVQRLRLGRELMVQSLNHTGSLIINSLEGATRAGMRQGGWRLGRMRVLVDEAAQHPSVHAIAVFNTRGQVLAWSSNRDHNKKHESPLAGLSSQVLSVIRQQRPFSAFGKGELVVGVPYDPLRNFRRPGRRLPDWACPVDPDQPPEPGRHSPQRHRGPDMGPGRDRGPRPDGPPTQAYAVVRLSTVQYEQARDQALRQSLLLAGLIFLGAGAVALGLWAAARRREDEMERLRQEVAQSQHLAAVGRLAGSVAHEVRNPLSALRGLVQFLAKDAAEGSKQAEYAQVAVSEVDRLERVVSSLLEYTRPRVPRRVELDIQESLVGTLEIMRDDPRAQGVDLQLKVQDGLPSVSADPDQIRQVVMNLLVNALEAVDGSGRIDMSATLQNDTLLVSVADDGPGLPPGDAEQVFDPFFSTRERGSGLGLAIARRIAQAHDGEITAGNQPSGGAVFTLSLPVGKESA